MDKSYLKYEDTIQCLFFLTSQQDIDWLCEILNKTVDNLAKDYLWHRDEFKITRPLLETSSGMLCLYLSSFLNSKFVF